MEHDVYMRIPKGLDLVIDNKGKHNFKGKPNDYVLQINRNIYGSKVSGKVWNEYLTNKIIQELGFCKSKIDKCIFYKGKTL